MSRTAVVTGASSGIGREIAHELARRGCRLVLVARRQEELAALAEELRTAHGANSEIAPCDLADPAARAELLTRLGPQQVEILVAAAGFGSVGPFHEADWAALARMVEVNVTSAMQLVHGLLPGMIARGRGRIMVVGSGAGHTDTRGATAYAATKWALHGLCGSLRLDLLGTGVTITEVAPGPVPTGFDAAAGADDGLATGLPDAMVISARECARASVRGMERGAELVYPGRAYGVLMRALDVVPRPVTRVMFAQMAKRA